MARPLSVLNVKRTHYYLLSLMWYVIFYIRSTVEEEGLCTEFFASNSVLEAHKHFSEKFNTLTGFKTNATMFCD